jgi:hypothetical protein
VDAEHREESEQSNSESAPEGRSHAGAYWLLSAFVFLLFYFLSIGPAAKVWLHFHMSGKHPRAEKVLETIYAPITALIDNFPAADRFFNWYVGDVWHAFPPAK